MKVTTTDFVDFSPSIFLANIGGSLGLWLGLGVLQLGQAVIAGVLAVWTRVQFLFQQQIKLLLAEKTNNKDID